MDRVSMNADWLRRLPRKLQNRFNQRIRAAAIKQVRKDLVLHGKSEHDLSKDDLEHLVAEAETDVKQSIKSKSMLAALVILGWRPWV